MLELRQLPSLLTDSVLIGHARKADVVWTQRQFVDLCIHVLDDKPPSFFLEPYPKEGKPRWAKSFKPDFEKRARCKSGQVYLGKHHLKPEGSTVGLSGATRRQS